jgi:hypothetical protein
MVERSGIRKGMNGSKGWFYVGTGLWTLRTVRRLAERQDEILISEELKPGQRLVISNGRATIEDGQAPAPKGRRARRKQAKADAKAAKKAEKRAARRAKRRGAGA